MVDNETLRKMSRDLVGEPDNYMHSFRKNLYMYIDRKDISLQEVAELADLPVGTLKTFMYGNATDCRLSTAVKLARVFNVSVDELVGCGTISRQTCESLQIIRQLPESFTHFVRWATHFHYDMLSQGKVTSRAIEIMNPEVDNNGNLKMTNNFDVVDVADLTDDISPKVFMGIRIVNDMFAPNYYEGNILLVANDRNARPGEHVIVCTGSNNMWILKRGNNSKAEYFSIRDGKKRATDDDALLVVGYVVKVVEE